MLTLDLINCQMRNKSLLNLCFHWLQLIDFIFKKCLLGINKINLKPKGVYNL